MTGTDLLLKLGLEGLKKHPLYKDAMLSKLMDYDTNTLRCKGCKHDYTKDTLCMFCPVFTVVTSEFLYKQI